MPEDLEKYRNFYLQFSVIWKKKLTELKKFSTNLNNYTKKIHATMIEEMLKMDTQLIANAELHAEKMIQSRLAGSLQGQQEASAASAESTQGLLDIGDLSSSASPMSSPENSPTKHQQQQSTGNIVANTTFTVQSLLQEVDRLQADFKTLMSATQWSKIQSTLLTPTPPSPAKLSDPSELSSVSENSLRHMVRPRIEMLEAVRKQLVVPMGQMRTELMEEKKWREAPRSKLPPMVGDHFKTTVDSLLHDAQAALADVSLFRENPSMAVVTMPSLKPHNNVALHHKHTLAALKAAERKRDSSPTRRGGAASSGLCQGSNNSPPPNPSHTPSGEEDAHQAHVLNTAHPHPHHHPGSGAGSKLIPLGQLELVAHKNGSEVVVCMDNDEQALLRGHNRARELRNAQAMNRSKQQDFDEVVDPFKNVKLKHSKIMQKKMKMGAESVHSFLKTVNYEVALMGPQGNRKRAEEAQLKEYQVQMLRPTTKNSAATLNTSSPYEVVKGEEKESQPAGLILKKKMAKSRKFGEGEGY